jgi:hypothetical protein
MTTFENKCYVLSDLWLNYRSDEEFSEFVSYNDLGLPLAYAISEGVVTGTPMSDAFINETFSLLLAAMGIPEDKGFESMNDLFRHAGDDIV